jgi:signal transduction histidine kinase
MHGEECLDEEVDIVGFDGVRRTILNSALPIRDASGAVVGGVAVNVDITDRKRAEVEMRRDGQFRERFIGIVSHDLRTPLSSILLGASALLRREDLPELLRTPIERFVVSAERMSRMIEELLDFTRIRSGGLAVKRRPADLLAITRQVVGEIEASHPNRSITFRYEGDLCGSWEPDRIAQVVSNLVGNAIDHSPEDAPVRISLWSEGEDVLLEVHNAGPPIPQEMLGVIFEPYRRVMQGATAAHASRGLGLGLFIVREIVVAHGGSIEVRSSVEEGATFTVRLRRE